jgi:hypothetical protein
MQLNHCVPAVNQVVSVHLDFVVVLSKCCGGRQDAYQYRKREKAATPKTVVENAGPGQRWAPVLIGQDAARSPRRGANSEDDDSEAGSSQVVAIVRLASDQPFRFYNDSQRILPAANELDVSAK